MSSVPAASPTAFEQLLAQAGIDGLDGRYREAMLQLEQALAICPDDRPGERARALALQAHFHPRLGQLQASVRCASQAVVLAEPLGDDKVLADALTSLTFVYAQLLMGRDALSCGLRALAAARRCGDAAREGWALNRIGVAHASLENPSRACETTEQALTLALDNGLTELAFGCLNNLAYFWLQRHSDAIKRGDATMLALSQRQALELAEQATRAARRASSPFTIAVALSNLCEALLIGNDGETALALIDEYEALSQRHGYGELAQQAGTQRAQLLRSKGQLRPALDSLLALKRGDAGALSPKLLRSVTRDLYTTHKECGDYREALAALEQLVDLERQIAQDTMALQGEVLLIREEVTQARERADVAQRDAERERERAGELEREQQRLRDEAAAWDRAAHEDALTGLHNRRHADAMLQMLAENARRDGRPLVLAMADVDHFKRINDEHGHAVGDRVLQQLALLLRHGLRDADLLARIGGEEFLIALLNMGTAKAQEVCERLRQSVASHDWSDVAPGLQVTVSIGVAAADEAVDAQRMFERADRALYAAKNGGRNRVELG